MTVPKPYFHFMVFLTNAFLLTGEMDSANRIAKATENGLDQNSRTEIAVSVISTLCEIYLMSAMFKTAVWLSEPIGDDVTDYNLDYDLLTVLSVSDETMRNMTTTEGGLTDRILTEALSNSQDNHPYTLTKEEMDNLTKEEMDNLSLPQEQTV